jgi:hypothetical protein
VGPADGNLATLEIAVAVTIATVSSLAVTKRSMVPTFRAFSVKDTRYT